MLASGLKQDSQSPGGGERASTELGGALLVNLVPAFLPGWPPGPTTDYGELVFVGGTMLISFVLLVAFGQWWQR